MRNYGSTTDLLFITNGNGEILNQIDLGRSVFEENTNITPVKIPGADKYRGYVPWGESNNRPQEIIELIRKDEVMIQNQQFNVLAGYSGGVQIESADDKELPEEIADFLAYNPPSKYWLEQQADMKHFFFTVSVIILNKGGDKIVELHHKEACYCRFETCNPTNGKIENVFYGNWEKSPKIEDLEVIPLLDIRNPIGDLMVRKGLRPDPITGEKEATDKGFKFAIANIFPTVSNKYYPFPPYCAVFNSGWFDIKQLIPIGKKAKFKNGLAVRWTVEVSERYWTDIFTEEKITDPDKKTERVEKEKQNFSDFLTGIEQSGKIFVTGFYINPKGETQPLVKFTKVDNTKEGGDWIEDSEEASNMICYAQGIHPSLIGATPGKTKGSFSGSDKRELFTMKQIMEKAYHDILLEPYKLIARFNKWKVKISVPLLMLTTLDKGKDAEQSTLDDQTQKTEK